MIVIDKRTNNKIDVTDDVLKMFPERYLPVDFDYKNVVIEEEISEEEPQKIENKKVIRNKKSKK